MIDKTVRIKLPNGEIRKHIRAKDEKEYEKKIEQIKRDALKGDNLNTIIDEWKEYHFKSINPNTQQGYIAPINDIKEQFGEMYLDDIKPIDVQNFLLYLLDDRKYAKQTLKLRLIVLNLIYKYAILNGYTQNNPCLAVQCPKKAVSHKRDIPTTREIESVLKAKNDEFLLPYFLLFTGCRVGEALAVRYEDIDRENNLITINKTIVFVDGLPTIQNHTKTDAGNRVIPLLEQLKNVLPKKKKGYVFGNDEPMKKGEVYYQWRLYKKRIGAEISPHQLRHAYATILYDAGLPVKDSQLLLGHNSAEVTQNIYTHITEERQKSTYQKLQEYATKKL